MEHAYRGAVEKQYFDALYLAVELHRQLGGMDLLLRGPAVAYASAEAATGPLTLGGRVIDTLTDPGADLARLRDEGVAVWVERPDLAAFGVGALLPGVGIAEPGEFAARWGEYRRVCFL